MEGYIITYQPDTTITCDGVKGGEVEVIGAGRREEDVTGLEEGTDYIIHVAAYNSIGEGEHSDEAATVHTLEEGTTCRYAYTEDSQALPFPS